MGARRAMVLFLVALGLPAIIVSCDSAPTRFFTLEPVAASPGVGLYSGPAVRIDAVHIPPPLDRIEIASESASGEMTIDDLSHWAAPLGQLVRQILTLDLMARLPEGRVIPAHLAKTPGAIGINVDILAFSADERGAHLRATWSMTTDDAKQGTTGHSVVLDDNAPIAGAAATAQAFSTILARLADRIAADIVAGGR